jgi:hypothetical protein
MKNKAWIEQQGHKWAYRDRKTSSVIVLDFLELNNHTERQIKRKAGERERWTEKVKV